MSKFIPSFHTSFSPSEKLTSEWCNEAIQYCWYNSNNKTLLHDKNIEEINQYASGQFDMTPFKRMFKSLRKSLDEKNRNNNIKIASLVPEQDTTGLDWSCYAIIPPKINSARAIIDKIPEEISVTALDPLAAKKKQDDITFLKNRPAIKNDLQEIADNLDIGEVDLGSTKYSAVPYSDDPYGFDLNEPDELEVFVNLLYSLDVEAAFETALQIIWELKKVKQVRSLETRDQFYYGVSVNRVFESSMTGLPDVEYVHPNNVACEDSDLPDFTDNQHRFIASRVTPLQLMNYFGDEIQGKDALDNIINDKKNGYGIKNNNKQSIPFSQFDKFKVDLIYCEVKTVDWIGVSQNPKSKKGFKSFTDDGKRDGGKLWGQNTIRFYWLKNTKYFFDIDRLPFANRKKGQETFQNFSTNIFRSQERSCVENCIGENKKGQVADLKLQFAVLQSLPAGKYIDIRPMRNALTALKQENNDYTIESLLTLLFERNTMIGDTEGFDGKNDGQFKPFYDIAGGLKSEVEGYIRIMADANRNIELYSGINQTLTGGQTPHPDALVGVQKLQLSAGLNALNYATEAIQHQCQQIGYLLANHVKMAIEKGGDAKKFIVNMIGSQKANVIDGLEELPKHMIGVKIKINQREEERLKFEQSLYTLRAKGVVSTADEFMLNNISNPTDKYRLLAIKEKQFMKREEKRLQDEAQQRQQLMEQQGQNAVAAANAVTDGKIKEVYAKGDVDSKIKTLAHQLGLSAAQFKAVVDRQQQADRQAGQVMGKLTAMQKKSELERQESYG